jgi:predicted transcriptional regulator of viral defense system
MICYTPVVVTRKTETFLKLLTRKQVIRSRDLDRAGIPRNYLNRLVERGQLRKIERGLYGVPELKASEHMTLVEVAARIPKAVICLLSALRVRVYSPAKTVADCFKFRYKIGSDIAVEALRECLRKKKATVDQLWEAAKVCRVANVMRPYMESLS